MSAANVNPKSPIVFISSTVEDLKPYRDAARFEAERAGFHVLMQEYFVASGDKPPLAKCLEEVSKADVLMVIVAHRYGWVPPDQPSGGVKSITWLECEHAANDKKRPKEVLAFLVDKGCDWPEQWREEYRLTVALREGNATPELLAEVQRDVAGLKNFKQWLEGRGIRATFCNTDSLRAEVGAALREWLKRRPEFAVSAPPGLDDVRKYLESLREQTASINIRGLQTGEQKARRFPIDELYIPLTVAGQWAGPEAGTQPGSKGGRAAGNESADAARHRVELQDMLRYRRLVIVGDPGAGKSTFLRRIAFAFADAGLKREPLAPTEQEAAAAGGDGGAGGSFLGRLAAALRSTFAGSGGQRDEAAPATGNDEHPFPILIRIAELSDHIRKSRGQGEYAGPATQENPAWLVDFLNRQNKDQKWNLDETFFERKLDDGSALLLLDGLDEAPGRVEREAMARLFEKATRAYERCRFVVTTRPLAYVGETVLDGFEVAQIEPLEPQAIDKFLEHWCHELFRESPREAERHLAELTEALRSTAEIRRMARNPVMLTALAVVHWNERRLPDQRADLYHSILTWLSRSRERRPGREPAERCLTLLEQLALAMQDCPDGRKVEVSKAEAAEMLAEQFPAEAETQRRHKDFIAQEEVDSGIVVSRGSDVRFWHLTFQEYLAAKAIGGLLDPEQYELLLAGDKIYRPEWREVALLLGGVLRQSGAQKVDGLVGEILNRLGERASLAQRARCVGLLGAMVRDLSPLGYEPADRRYKSTLESVEGIFDARKAATVEFSVRLEAAEALGQAGDPRLHKDNWVNIDAGKFPMGAQKEDPSKPNYDPEAEEDESPVHEVYLDAYQIGRYPVTVEQYRRFVEDENGYGCERWWAAGGFGETKGPDGWDDQVLHPNRPVVNVSWYEAAAYCAWPGARLPTEAEWERAARGTSGRKYPWGDEEPDSERANYEGKVRHATPVGLYPRGATPGGIEDMGGNVWEWVADRYGADYYGQSPGRNPEGPRSGDVRVLRGGAWNYKSRNLRAAARNWDEPRGRDDDLGFRCVREVLA